MHIKLLKHQAKCSQALRVLEDLPVLVSFHVLDYRVFIIVSFGSACHFMVLSLLYVQYPGVNQEV